MRTTRIAISKNDYTTKILLKHLTSPKTPLDTWLFSTFGISQTSLTSNQKMDYTYIHSPSHSTKRWKYPMTGWRTGYTISASNSFNPTAPDISTATTSKSLSKQCTQGNYTQFTQSTQRCSRSYLLKQPWLRRERPISSRRYGTIMPEGIP